MDRIPVIPAAELALLQDRDIIAAKAKALGSVQQLLWRVKEVLAEVITETGFSFPEGADTVTGRMHKGENYRGMPWVVLDYPRLFSASSVFAFRSMFWWGNFLSCTLHLEGEALEPYRGTLEKNHAALRGEKDLYMCVGDGPWEYHYGDDNYKKTSSLLQEDVLRIIRSGRFIKLSCRVALDRWEAFPGVAAGFVRTTLSLLGRPSRP